MTSQPGTCTEPSDIKPERASFFIDFDGTLAAIAERPDRVTVEPDILSALEEIDRATGRLAIVSGRPIAELDRFLTPLRLPLAGTHGAQFRNPDGTLYTATFDAGMLEELVNGFRAFAADRHGLLVEAKPGSVALHYRARPELAQAALAKAQELEAAFSGVELMRGKMVVELRLGGRSKADAVSHFMALRPFRNHRPVFVGDDVTDEDGFRRAQEMGGTGIKIGPEETVADARFADIESFWAWLKSTAGRLKAQLAQDAPQSARPAAAVATERSVHQFASRKADKEERGT